MSAKPEKISNILHVSALYQANDGAFPDALYVHCLPAAEVYDVAFLLGRTGGICTTDIGCTGLTGHKAAAGRADITYDEGSADRRTLFPDYGTDLGYYLSRLIDPHRIADPDIQLVDEVLVVESCPIHLCSAKLNRVKHGGGSNSAGTAHRQLNVPDYSFLFLRRVLIGYRPARHLCRSADSFPICQIVQFDHSAINIVGQLGTGRTYCLNSFPYLVGSPANLIAVNDGYSLFLHKFVSVCMSGKFPAPDRLQIKYEQ